MCHTDFACHSVCDDMLRDSVDSVNVLPTTFHEPSVTAVSYMFSSYYQNVRGLRSKLDVLRQVSSILDFSVIIFSAT